MKPTLTILLLTLCLSCIGQQAPIHPESRMLIIPSLPHQPVWGCDLVTRSFNMTTGKMEWYKCHGLNGSNPDSGIIIHERFVDSVYMNPDWRGGKK